MDALFFKRAFPRVYLQPPIARLDNFLSSWAFEVIIFFLVCNYAFELKQNETGSFIFIFTLSHFRG